MPFLEAAGARLHYVEAGTGEPLVLLHGLGADIQDWTAQMPVFAQHFRVLAFDLPGFGQSPRGTRALNVPRYAQDIRAALDALGIPRCILIGHSMGGAVALQTALEQPQAYPRLVIANSVPTFRPRTFSQRMEILYRRVVMRLLGPARLSRISAARMYPGEALAALRERSIARGSRNNMSHYLEALGALTRWSVLERLHELPMPVQVIAAGQDYFSRADMLQFAHALPHGRLHTVRDARHGLPQERPEEFNRIVLKFLGVSA